MTDVNWEEKCWGRVKHLFSSLSAAVSYLEVNKGFQCSRHRHAKRSNMFVVIEGQIEIELFSEIKSFSEVTTSVLKHSITYVLYPGDVLDVNAGIWHRFKVLESGKLVEVYRTKGDDVCSLDDIERFDTGGEIDN